MDEDINPSSEPGGSGGTIFKLILALAAILMVMAILPAVQGVTVTKNVNDAIAFITQYGGYTVFANTDLPTSAIVGVSDTQTLSNKTFTGTTGFASITSTSINMSGDILPTTNNSRSLGSSVLKWINGWFVNLNAEQLTTTTGNITTLNAPTGRGATITVAASDATPSWKAQADYVCTGTADQITINNAIGNLTTDVSGFITGTILLSEGDFSINGTIVTGNKSVWIIGQGQESTRIGRVAGSNTHGIIFGDGATAMTGGGLRNVSLQGGKAANTAGIGVVTNGTTSLTIQGNYINGWNGNAISLNGTVGKSGGGSLIKDNTLSNTDGATIFMSVYGGSGILENNFIHGSATDFDLISATSASEWMIWNNNLFNSGNRFMRFFSCSDFTVENNYCNGADTWGIELAGNSHNMHVIGNIVRSSGVRANNTYQAFLSNGNNNVFEANKVYGVTANKPSNAFAIQSPATNNTVIGNLIESIAGVGITDTGTNTMIRSNQGYVTENSGNVTLVTGTNTIAVTHGLAATPTWVQFSSTSNETGWLRAVSVGTTTFNISSSYNVTANTTIFWRATVGAGN